MEDRPLDRYLDDLSSRQTLGREEEKELAARIAKGDERAVARLVEANLKFVVSVARSYQGRGLAIDDLVSEGNIAMTKAARKFDPDRGARFVSYAAPAIRRQMEKAIDREALTKRIETDSKGHTRSVDAPLGRRSNMSLLAVITNTDSVQADQRTYQQNVRWAVEKAMEALDKRQQTVIAAYFAPDGDNLTMAEIAAETGLKRERVRQVRDQAIRKLRSRYKALINK